MLAAECIENISALFQIHEIVKVKLGAFKILCDLSKIKWYFPSSKNLSLSSSSTTTSNSSPHPMHVMDSVLSMHTFLALAASFYSSELFVFKWKR